MCTPRPGSGDRRRHKPAYLCLHLPDFPAQVLTAREPGLRNKPLAVIQQAADSHKSLVVALSPQARQRGLYTGMPVQQAQKQCSKVIIRQLDQAAMEAASQKLQKILANYTPDFTVSAKTGQALLNLSGMERYYRGRLAEIPGQVQQEIKLKLGLGPVNAGLAGSAAAAAVCSRAAQPGGVMACPPGEEERVLYGLSVHLLPGLTKWLREKLKNYNIRTIGDLSRLSRDFLRSHLSGPGDKLYLLVHGWTLDRTALARIRQVEAGVTLDWDTNDKNRLQNALRKLADELGFKLRQAQRPCRCLALTRVYSDGLPEQRSQRLAGPTQDFLALLQAGQEMLAAANSRRVAVKQLALQARQLQEDNGQQGLFQAPEERKQQAVGEALYKVRRKIGFQSVTNGNIRDARFRIQDAKEGMGMEGG